MSSVVQHPQFFKGSGKKSPDILSTLDLIDHEIEYCQSQAENLSQLASWYGDLAATHIALRRSLAADVTEALRDAERLIQ